MRIFLTGADGFIGSHLTEKLIKSGFEVIALCQYNSFNNIGWLKDSNIINNKNLKMWKKKINEILLKPEDYQNIKKNAIDTAKNYSWDNRAKKFLKFMDFIQS